MSVIQTIAQRKTINPNFLPVADDVSVDSIVKVLNKIVTPDIILEARDGGIYCEQFAIYDRLRDKIQFTISFLEEAVKTDG